MRRTIAVLGLAVFVTAVGAAGCSTAGADAAANHPVEYPHSAPCDVADTDSLLRLTVGGDIAAQIAQPFVFDVVECSGTTATAYTMDDGVTSPVAVRFEYSVGSWRPMAVRPASEAHEH